MVEVFGFQIWETPAKAAAAGSIAGDIIFWIVVVLIIAGLLFWFFWMRQFKHSIRIKHLTGTKKLIVYDKFRIFKSVDGVKFIQLMRRKEVLPVPPPDAIELNINGTMAVDCYYTEDGEYIFSEDDIKFSCAGAWKYYLSQMPEDFECPFRS